MCISDRKVNPFFVLRFIFSNNPFIFIIVSFFSLCLSFIPALKIILFSKIVDIFVGEVLIDKLFYIGFVYFIIVIFQNLYPLIQGILEKIIYNTLFEKVSIQVLNLILSKEYVYWENSESLNLFNRVLENPQEEFFNLYKNILLITINLLQMFFIILVIWKISIYLGILLVVILTLLVLVSYIGGKKEYLENFKAQKSRRFSKYLEEVISLREYSEEREIYHTYKNLIPRFRKERHIGFNMELKSKFNWFLTSLKAGFFSTSLLITISILLIFPVKYNNLSLGMYIAFLNSMITLIPTLSWNIPTNIKEISKGVKFLDSLNKIIGLELEDDLGEEILNSIESIEFKNVTFKYPNSDKIIFNNLNLKLTKGNNYGIVGINGAGKTTIIKLILRLYDDYSGEIFLNDKNIKLYKKESVRKNISLIFQDFAKYGMSIKENILLGRYDDQIKLEKVLKNVNLYEKVKNLALETDTVLGKKMEESYEFSGGEWQRLAIARCLYNKKSLNIFDEPTSKIDSKSEIDILNTIIENCKGNISIVISHKLGVIKKLDKIIVIDDGTVVEEGDFDNLILKKGFFYKMYEKQKEWYISE